MAIPICPSMILFRFQVFVKYLPKADETRGLRQTLVSLRYQRARIGQQVSHFLFALSGTNIVTWSKAFATEMLVYRSDRTILIFASRDNFPITETHLPIWIFPSNVQRAYNLRKCTAPIRVRFFTPFGKKFAWRDSYDRVCFFSSVGGVARNRQNYN